MPVGGLINGNGHRDDISEAVYALFVPVKNTRLSMAIQPDGIPVFFLRHPVKISFIKSVKVAYETAPAKAVLFDHAVLAVRGDELHIDDMFSV